MKITKIALLVVFIITMVSCNSSEKIVGEASKNETSKKEEKTTKASAKITDETLSHLTETYGSVCCPKDPKHNEHIDKYVREYERLNHVDIVVYYVVQGREGEATYFVNLDKLNKKEKMKFLMARKNLTYDETVKELANALPILKIAPKGLKIQQLN